MSITYKLPSERRNNNEESFHEHETQETDLRGNRVYFKNNPKEKIKDSYSILGEALRVSHELRGLMRSETFRYSLDELNQEINWLCETVGEIPTNYRELLNKSLSETLREFENYKTRLSEKRSKLDEITILSNQIKSHSTMTEKEIFYLRRAYDKLKKEGEKYSNNSLEKIALDGLTREMKRIYNPKPYEINHLENNSVKIPEEEREYKKKGFFARIKGYFFR